MWKLGVWSTDSVNSASVKLRQIGEGAFGFDWGGGVASCCCCFPLGPRDAGLLVGAVSIVGNWMLFAFDRVLI